MGLFLCGALATAVCLTGQTQTPPTTAATCWSSCTEAGLGEGASARACWASWWPSAPGCLSWLSPREKRRCVHTPASSSASLPPHPPSPPPLRKQNHRRTKYRMTDKEQQNILPSSLGISGFGGMGGGGGIIRFSRLSWEENKCRTEPGQQHLRRLAQSLLLLVCVCVCVGPAHIVLNNELLHPLLPLLEHLGALVVEQWQLLQHHVLGRLDLGAQVQFRGLRVWLVIWQQRTHRCHWTEYRDTWITSFYSILA